MSQDFFNENALGAGQSEGQKIWVERFHFNINLKERNRHVFDISMKAIPEQGYTRVMV